MDGRDDLTGDDLAGDDLARGQRIGWAFGAAGSTTIVYVVNVVLMYYLVTALGMDPIVAGSFMLFGRFFDAAADLLIGHYSVLRRGRYLATAAGAGRAAGDVHRLLCFRDPLFGDAGRDHPQRRSAHLTDGLPHVLHPVGGAGGRHARASDFHKAASTIVGTPESVAAALRKYYDLDVTRFLISGFDPLGDITQLGRDLIPRLRAFDQPG